MDKAAIDKILELSPVDELEIRGRYFTDRKVYEVRDPEATPLAIHTITGLIDLLDTLSDDDRSIAIFHVVDYNKVRIVSNLFGVERQREVFAVSDAHEFNFRFGQYLAHDDFIVWLLSMFVPDDNTAKVLKIVSHLQIEAKAGYSDDGTTQTVTAKVGITKVENVDLPNPITLRPYRTFPDIEQPESKFVLRLRQERESASPLIALFEADGGAWKNTAIASIKAYLQAQAPDVKVIA